MPILSAQLAQLSLVSVVLINELAKSVKMVNISAFDAVNHLISNKKDLVKITRLFQTKNVSLCSINCTLRYVTHVPRTWI